MLSDLGAEVIKIEAPEGDLGRIPSVAPYRGVSGLFLTYNRNKQSVVINLKSRGRPQIFLRSGQGFGRRARQFPARRARAPQDRFPDAEQINPRIVQCSVTGFGMQGAYKDYPALDLIIQAISGHMGITGEPGRPPVRVGIPLADMSGGIFSCKAVLAALFARERTGKAQRVELSMFDAMLNLLAYIGTMYLTNGELPQPPGSAHEYTVPWQAFQTKDGYLVIATRQEVFWKKLCTVLGDDSIGADPRFATNEARVEHRATLVPLLESIFRKRTTADWMKDCARSMCRRRRSTTSTARLPSRRWPSAK